jgi:hypothetical protein
MRVHRRTDVVEAPAADPRDPVVVPEAPAVRRTTATPWSPAQLVGMAIGIGFVVLGIAAVAKTGSSHLYTPTRTIWHLGHTPLLGWIDVAFGALLILASAVPGAVRSLMALLGAAALAFGIVILVDAAPYRVHRYFAATHVNGWLYVAVGGALLLAAFASPVFAGRSVDVRR